MRKLPIALCVVSTLMAGSTFAAENSSHLNNSIGMQADNNGVSGSISTMPAPGVNF